MSRVQLALNVDDIEESIAFYSKLFAIEPTKVRPGYGGRAPDPGTPQTLKRNSTTSPSCMT